MQDFFSTHVLPQLMSWDNDKQAQSEEFGIQKWRKRNKWMNTKQIILEKTHWLTWSTEHLNMPYGQWSDLRAKQQKTWKEFVYSEWPCSRVSNFERITDIVLDLNEPAARMDEQGNVQIRVYAINYRYAMLGLPGLRFA